MYSIIKPILKLFIKHPNTISKGTYVGVSYSKAIDIDRVTI